MTKTLRKRLSLLGTSSLFAVAMVIAPVQLDFANGTLDKAVAYAGNHGVSGGGPISGGGHGGTSGGGGASGTTAGGGSDTRDSSGKS